jgi:tetratricopeptide (TPR) repeat protein
VVRFEETGLHFRRLPPRTARASLLSHQAYLQRAVGRFDDGRIALGTALKIAESAGAELDAARLVAQRGALEVAAGHLEEAERWLERSLAERRRLREHRGILLTLANIAVVAGSRGESARADELVAQAGRMADEAVDGPGMGAVQLARAEIARTAGDAREAREAIERGIESFYARAGLTHQLAWLRVQQAYLSLELDEPVTAEHHVAAARARFTEGDIALGLAYCGALEKRLRAVNGALT